MRIGLVHATLPEAHRKPGGVDVQVHGLAQQLVLDGHEVRVFSASRPPEGSRYAHVRLPRPALWRHPLGRMLVAPWTLNRLAVEDLDVVHLHGDDWFYWRRPRPTVRTFHGTSVQELRAATTVRRCLTAAALVPLELLAARLATGSYGVSPAGYRGLRARGWLPNGVALDAEGSAPRREAILFVGTWGGRKRGEALWRAFREVVRPLRPESELWMVSDHCPPAPGVSWHQRPTDAELAGLYRRAAVFCLPSSYEGFGIPYVEAMAHGLPVVATPNAGSRFVLNEGTCGVLTSIDEVGDALVALLEDPARRTALADRGLARARHFGWQHVAARHEEAYRRAIARWQQRHRVAR